jgi:hypothetical protein
MTLLSPWWLLGLAPVAMAAAWALWRPARLELTVPSLELWQRAIDALAPSDRRSKRRLSLSWWCLLAGAILAVLALAQPVRVRQGPQRHIAIGVVPGYELLATGRQKAWLPASDALLARLSPSDRVQILRPALLGGATDWMTPSEAHMQLADLPLLPALTGNLPLPTASPKAQKTVIFRFLPAPQNDGRVVQILGEKRQGGAAAVDAHLNHANQAELFVRLPDDNADVRITPILPQQASLALQRPAANVVTAIGPAADAYAIDVNGLTTYLARLPGQELRVAVLGRASEALQRYVQTDILLRPTARQEEAELVIAVGVEPPADKPALVLEPSSPPPGWQRSEPLQNVALARSDADADSPLLQDVDLGGMAIRRAQPWRATAGDVLSPRERSRAALSVDGRALVVHRPRDGERPRRVYLAFDVSQINTNIDQSEGFLVLLANAVRWLGGDVQPTDDYSYVRPVEAVGWQDWQGVTISAATGDAGPLPWPGIYRDRTGRLQALSIPGVQAVQQLSDPLEMVAAMELPSPVAAQTAAEYWPWLGAAAGALWILGWWVRIQY